MNKKNGLIVLMILAIIILLFLNQINNRMMEDLKANNLYYIEKYSDIEKINNELIEKINMNIEEKKFDEKKYLDLLEKYDEDVLELTDSYLRDDYVNIVIESKYNIDSKTIESDLLEKSEIIKISKDQPWKMRFNDVHVLSTKLVFASFDDGHGQGYGVYEFKIENNMIKWETIYENMDWN